MKDPAFNLHFDRSKLLQEVREIIGTPASEEEHRDGTFVIIGGQPEDVVVRLHGSKVTVSSFSIDWEGPHTPIVRLKTFASLNWKRIPLLQLSLLLSQLITVVREISRSAFRQCAFCKEPKAPHSLHSINGRNVCHGCSERHLRIKH